MARRSSSPSRSVLPTSVSQTSVSPIRTCVGCGVRTAKSDLLRLVAVGDDIVPDSTGRLPGRGAYLHPSRGCLKRAQRRKALARALRAPGAIPVAALAEDLAAG